MKMQKRSTSSILTMVLYYSMPLLHTKGGKGEEGVEAVEEAEEGDVVEGRGPGRGRFRGRGRPPPPIGVIQPPAGTDNIQAITDETQLQSVNQDSNLSNKLPPHDSPLNDSNSNKRSQDTAHPSSILRVGSGQEEENLVSGEMIAHIPQPVEEVGVGTPKKSDVSFGKLTKSPLQGEDWEHSQIEKEDKSIRKESRQASPESMKSTTEHRGTNERITPSLPKSQIRENNETGLSYRREDKGSTKSDSPENKISTPEIENVSLKEGSKLSERVEDTHKEVDKVNNQSQLSESKQAEDLKSLADSEDACRRDGR